MIVVTALESVYTLVFMSLDRFLAGEEELLKKILKIQFSLFSLVVHPISSMSIRTERNALMYVV